MSTLDSSTQKKKKLSPDEVENLTKRIYSESMSTKQRKLGEMERKVYATEPAKTLDAATITASVTRQVDDEMARRKRRDEQLKSKFYSEAPPTTMDQGAIEDSVRRIYSDAIRVKTDNLRKLDNKHAFPLPKTVTIDKETVKASADRLSKPKKQGYSEDEINAIMGFK
jgi:hypothetical protein